ncbi:MAG: hypothetical protein ACYTGS_14180, partial [Planctomycetota bacterium]
MRYRLRPVAHSRDKALIKLNQVATDLLRSLQKDSIGLPHLYLCGFKLLLHFYIVLDLLAGLEGQWLGEL